MKMKMKKMKMEVKVKDAIEDEEKIKGNRNPRMSPFFFLLTCNHHFRKIRKGQPMFFSL